jgi:AcrR family transcriptional regulator
MAFGKVGRPPEDRQLRQREIFLAVAPLLVERGVRGLTMRDAARSAHLSVAGLYHYFPTKRELVLHSLRPDAFKRMCGDFMKASGHLQAEAPGRFLREFVEFSVHEVSFVRPAIHAALEIGANEFWAAQEAGIATALEIMVAALRGAYPTATDVELAHLARAIRRTLMAALLDRSVGDEELREQLRALMLGDAILRRRHRDTVAAANAPVANAGVAVQRKPTIRAV